MPGAQIEFPDGAGNIETNVPRGHCNVRVQIADHNHPFRHRNLHEREGNARRNLRAFVLHSDEPAAEHR
jgi:hypothetical protein